MTLHSVIHYPCTRYSFFLALPYLRFLTYFYICPCIFFCLALISFPLVIFLSFPVACFCMVFCLSFGFPSSTWPWPRYSFCPAFPLFFLLLYLLPLFFVFHFFATFSSLFFFCHVPMLCALSVLVYYVQSSALPLPCFYCTVSFTYSFVLHLVLTLTSLKLGPD